ncbi:ent-kaurene oxidase [Plectosphaerella cucumerina]|uniref:Ent-kaurene oxidase n=1 Tax=Plectosphaerella cucumerina TaxID=40658 RepID=A0A8K0X8H4_9PEZI|nr:ent-kaurene oxidase [Plectosphaerella cucumerina]
MTSIMDNPTFQTILAELAARRVVIGSGLVVLAAAWLLPSLFETDNLSHIPIVGKGSKGKRRKYFSSGGAWELYDEGYNKFKNGLFRLATASLSESIVVSPKYLAELKRLPDDVLSFSGAINESMQTHYTKVNPDIPALPRIIQKHLTPALGKLNRVISEEVIKAMALELPQTSEWEEVDINKKLLRIVAIISGRIFVGPELCHDEKYLDVAINYTVDVMIAAYVVGMVPPWMRPWVAPRLPMVKKLQTRIREADEFLRPVVKERREAMADPSNEMPDDMLQWIINSQKELKMTDDKEFAELQLGVSMAAIHTTTLTTLNSLFSLAVMPEIVPELQDDIRQALAESDGDFSSSALQNMKKLDSFLKETMRYYPLAAASFHRKVLKPFQLSTGEFIPKGVIIEVPAASISSDDGVFEDADKFDALRFYKLRQLKKEQTSGVKAAETVANSQFVSVSESSLTFGYGRHACPGRFFAANEIKMILANLLLHYEIRNPDGVTERHKNIRMGAQLVPDYKKKIMVRKLGQEKA